MKRKIMSLLAVSLILGSVESISAATISFSDITNVPWKGAETYINSVANAGLMVGDMNAKGQRVFRAKDKVTYCEVVQLVYSILGKSGKLGSTSGLVTKWTNVMRGNNIPSWSYEPVAYALENKIISVNELQRFMKSATVNNNASREDVAVIMGRALSKFQSLNSNASLTFKDKSEIASTSVPYIDLLVRQGIIVGDNNNEFNPRNYINRAEMAVIVSKTYSKLSGSSTGTPTTPGTANESITGAIVAVENYGSKVIIAMMVNGAKQGFIGDNSVPVTYNGKRVNYTDLSTGDYITLNYDKSTFAPVSVVATSMSNDSSSSLSIQGRVDNVENDKIMIVDSKDAYHTYSIASGCEFWLDEVESTLKDFYYAIDDGENIDVKMTLNGAGKVTKIEGTSTMATIKGKVTSMSESKVTVKKENHNSTETYRFDNDCRFKLEDSSSDAEDIIDECDDDFYAILYLNSKDEVVLMKAYEDAPDEDYDGTLISIDEDEIKIKRSGSSKTKTYDMDDDVTLRLDGSSTTIKKLNDKLDDDCSIGVDLDLDSKDRVTRVDAEILDDDDDYDGEVTKITSDYIYIKDDRNKTKKYDYDEDDIVIRIDGSVKSLSKLEDLLDEDEDKLMAVIVEDDDTIEKLIITTKSKDDDDDEYDGILTRISSSYMWIEDDDGDTEKYRYLDDVTIRVDGSSKSLSKLKDLVEDDDLVLWAEIRLDDGDIERIDITTDDDDGKKTDKDGEYYGELREVDDDSIRIKEFSSDDRLSFDLESDTKIRINSSYKDTDDLNDYLDDKDHVYVRVSVFDEEVIRIEASTDKSKIRDSEYDEYEGTIVSINKNSIEFKKDSGSKKTYDIASWTRYTLDDKTSSYSDLEEELDDDNEIYATIRYESDESLVTVIEGEVEESRTVKGDLYSVSSSRIRIETSSGSKKYYDLVDEDDLIITIDGDDADLDDLDDELRDSDITVKLTLNSRDEVTRIVAETE